MTLDEAKKWAGIIATADGGCDFCVDNLAKKANKEFPEFNFVRVGRKVIVSLRERQGR